jgi:hypothetical protein|tara:strand:- start:6390 stop:6599 length:210 start_codon:yes stop_codon:yes gene_type:complete
MASKFKKKETTKEKIKKYTKKQVEKDAKDLYPVSDADVKKLKDAAKGNTEINNMALIKALKKRFDKVKK